VAGSGARHRTEVVLRVMAHSHTAKQNLKSDLSTKGRSSRARDVGRRTAITPLMCSDEART
jgi:hypothetical protein